LLGGIICETFRFPADEPSGSVDNANYQPNFFAAFDSSCRIKSNSKNVLPMTNTKRGDHPFTG
jgi:hypothetical protein